MGLDELIKQIEEAIRDESTMLGVRYTDAATKLEVDRTTKLILLEILEELNRCSLLLSQLDKFLIICEENQKRTKQVSKEQFVKWYHNHLENMWSTLEDEK